MLVCAGINDYCFVAYFNIWKTKKKLKKIHQVHQINQWLKQKIVLSNVSFYTIKTLEKNYYFFKLTTTYCVSLLNVWNTLLDLQQCMLFLT